MEDKEGETRESNWGDLTAECLLNVFCRLSLKDRWQGPTLVCKSWLNASKDPSLYPTFNLDTYFDFTPESPLWWTPLFQNKIDAMLKSILNFSHPDHFSSLVQIRVRHCSDSSIHLISQRCPNLEVLSIRSCPNVSDESMAKIADGCPKLKELDISYCYEISHESLALLGRQCANLRILKRNFMNYLDPSQHVGIVPNEYLNACPQDGDTEAAAIGKFMPGLLHLELRFSKFSAKGLQFISQGCLDLEYLDLSGCVNMTSRDIANAESMMKNIKNMKKPNFYIPRSVFHTERYGHWQLYDERFQTDVFRI